MASTGAELMNGQAELWCHAFGYLKSMALQCAIKLGIPNAIHRCGGSASLPELLAALPVVAANKRPCVSRIMAFLSASGIFQQETTAPSDGEISGVRYRYSLTAASRLLVDAGDAIGSDRTMASDSRLVAEVLVRECSPVFTGVTLLVDVGGGHGTTAIAIARAFPQVKCSVLELPHVVDAMPADTTVKFIAGDMMEFIPPADCILLKVNRERRRNWHKIFLDAGFTKYKITPVFGARSLTE
ncbi:hypothetical protein U9M48_001583, partial [Paspalum notatum var. saurae]